MPHQTTPLTPRKQRAIKAERTRKLLDGSNRKGADSDEEDAPWEWIYEEDGEGSADERGDTATKNKRKRRNAVRTQERRIVGAKTGGLKCEVGDIVLISPDGGGADWIGIIMEFVDDDDEEEMAAKFLCMIYSTSQGFY